MKDVKQRRKNAKKFIMKLSFTSLWVYSLCWFLNILLKKQDFPKSIKNRLFMIPTKYCHIVPKKYLIYLLGFHYRDNPDPHGKRCPIPFDYTEEPKEANVLVFSIFDSYGIKPFQTIYQDYNIRPDQYTAHISMESDGIYNFSDYTNLFNITIDYRLSSDVPIPYSESFEYEEGLPVEKKNGFVASFISNCLDLTNRTNYIEELMKSVSVDNFGMCNHNNNVEQLIPFECKNITDKYAFKKCVIKHYKFTIAFENSVADDYVTEKFYQPLSVGSVPIYRGCQNIRDFAPPHSFIDANEFESVEALGKYLKYLDSNDTAYNEYLEWRKNKDYGNLRRLMYFRHYKESSFCAMIERLEGLWINPYFTQWERETNLSSEKGCSLCLQKYNKNKQRILIENKTSISVAPLTNFQKPTVTLFNGSYIEIIYNQSSKTNSFTANKIIESLFWVFPPFV